MKTFTFTPSRKFLSVMLRVTAFLRALRPVVTVARTLGLAIRYQARRSARALSPRLRSLLAKTPRRPWVAFRALFNYVGVGAFAYWAGRSGFGSYYLIPHSHDLVRVWHLVIAPVAAYAIPAMWYSNRELARFLVSRGVNAFAIGLFMFPFYCVLVGVTFAVWGVWTFPFYLLSRVFVIVYALTGPFRRLAIVALTPTAADVASDIIRDMALR